MVPVLQGAVLLGAVQAAGRQVLRSPLVSIISPGRRGQRALLRTAVPDSDSTGRSFSGGRFLRDQAPLLQRQDRRTESSGFIEGVSPR